MASDIWLYDFKEDKASKLTNFDGKDALAMWQGDHIYFISDRGENKRNNIWKLNIINNEIAQVTRFKDFDIKWPSLGPDSIVFENGGKIYLLDLESQKTEKISISVPADLPHIRPKLKKLHHYIKSYELSPSGKKAVFEARGEIFLLGSKNEIIKNLTNSSASAERHPSWSPKEDRIAYLSDSAGEYELNIQNLSDSAIDAVALKPGYYYNLVWSPDAKYILLTNNIGELFVADTKTKEVKLIDKDEWSRIRYFSWSPDSRFVAYSKRLKNYQSSVFIYDINEQRKTEITSDYYNDSSPVFSTNGKYLAFFSDRHFRPLYGDMDDTWIYPGSTELFLITLQKDMKSPFLPKDLESPHSSDNDKKNDKKNRSRKAPKVIIDFDNIEDRVTKVPVKHGDYKSLQFKGNTLFYLRAPVVVSGGRPHAGNLITFNLDEKKEKILMRGINNYSLSGDGKSYLYKAKRVYGVAGSDKEQKVGAGKLAANKISAFIDLRKEWGQIFHEAWRIERDFFYDPNMHGVDWQSVRSHYSKLLKHVVSREDLSYLIGEMVSELNSSHTYVRGGDFNDAAKISVGLLGCDFGYDSANNAYYVKKIYSGGVWDEEVRSPLALAGIDVKEDDYILSVNGRSLDTYSDPWAAFQNLAGEVAELTVNSRPSTTGARKIVVKLLDRNADLRLRYLHWVETNRKKVDEMTGGKIGYVYVPDTGAFGQNELVRQFIPQRIKQGLIIDERFNGGGQVPDRFIELLNRPIYNYWARREQNPHQSPFVSHAGPKVMIINGWSGSGGDAFPHYFKKAGLGKLVGKRTLGGLIGIGGYPRFIDGGYITTPNFAFLDTGGNWDIEGYGVSPDYEVENISFENPEKNDPQLDKAVEIILEMVNNHKSELPKVPQYPDRSN
ncbi:MAG: peptidase S41 [Candidatus Dadabacteria bacterium]|nr:peptidase S41 [Candidatus Dadabacteria bacterium]NIS07402.1 peptidase S41 [Candidatus Dadabacteria bacterium]NIV41434.1 peptidase S41 [Candidatus Dadabacteria bacterium]NIY21058.1 peptidase S41 [Candidatus Dadabacteria bacterium]